MKVAPFGFTEAEQRVMTWARNNHFPKDLHREAAAKMFNVAPADVTPEQRAAAKRQAFFDLYRPLDF